VHAAPCNLSLGNGFEGRFALVRALLETISDRRDDPCFRHLGRTLEALFEGMPTYDVGVVTLGGRASAAPNVASTVTAALRHRQQRDTGP
jgi:hypothetical protein